MENNNNKAKVKIKNPFFITVLVAVAFYLLLKFAVQPPLPSTLVIMYMVTLIFALLLYISSSEATFKEFSLPINIFLVSPKLKRARMVAGVVIPLFAGWMTFSKMQPGYSPPGELRTVHPTPPSQIDVHGNTVVLAQAKNPFRDSAKIEQAIEDGRAIYFGNCMPCHGDNLDGKGHWADRINPIPINFRDPGTIAMMSESFIFWRVAKGGIGLPDEATPWSSAMPPWEKGLTEDEIWKVVLYLYEETGYVPKSFE